MIRIPFFKPFIPLVLSGEKTATTRNDLKIKRGEKFVITNPFNIQYGIAECTDVFKITMNEHGQEFKVCNKLSDIRKLNNLPEIEGFSSWENYRDFIRKKYGFPFSGKVMLFKVCGD